jgi:hypothetical protein
MATENEKPNKDMGPDVKSRPHIIKTPSGTELKEYTRLKLEVADIVLAAMQMAREQKNQEAEAYAQRLLARIAEDRFNLVVVGLFNRGKSPLMRVAQRVQSLLFVQQTEHSLREHAARNPEFFSDRLQKLETRIEELGRLQSKSAAAVRQRIVLELPERLAPELHAAVTDANASALGAMTGFFSGMKLFRASPHLADLEKTVQLACGRRLSEQLDCIRRNLLCIVRDLGGEDLRNLSGLPEEVTRFGRELFGLHPVASVDPDECNHPRGNPAISVVEREFDWRVPAGSWLLWIPISRIRRHFLKRCRRSVGEALLV